MQRARKQQEVVEVIEKLGGQARREYWLAGSDVTRPAWLEKLLGKYLFSEVVLVELTGPRITDVTLEYLRDLDQLQYVKLDKTEVTDAGISNLRHLRRLQILIIDESQVSDACLVHLKDLSELQTLDLLNTQVTNEGVLKLLQTLPYCSIMRIDNTPPTAHVR